MRLALLILASCAPPQSALAARPTAETIEVIVLDDYRTHESCDDVAAHRIEVAVDGVAAAQIDIPCTTAVHAPPAQIASRPFALAAGHHRVHARELAGLEAQTELELPALERGVPATKLVLWANDDELDFQGLRATLYAGDP